MTIREQVSGWALEQADQLQSDMRFEPSGTHRGYWAITDASKKGLLMARVASALEFLRQHVKD